MTSKETLGQHAQELTQSTGAATEVLQEGNRLFVVLHKYHLPLNTAKVESTDVLFVADTQYPLSAMDMFWTEPEVVRPDGSVFQGADVIEEYLGRKWRRFSYHRNTIWNTNGNPLMDHYAFMEARWTASATR
jgi:nuclear transport factor 2 (NTF2) superfamily protein